MVVLFEVSYLFQEELRLRLNWIRLCYIELPVTLFQYTAVKRERFLLTDQGFDKGNERRALGSQQMKSDLFDVIEK